MQIDPYLSPSTKLKSKWIKKLNINPDTLNLTEEKVGNSLKRIGTGDNFLNRTPIVQILRSTINKWNLINLKVFLRQKTPSRGHNDSLQNRKRFSPTPHLTEGRFPKSIKNSRN